MQRSSAPLAFITLVAALVTGCGSGARSAQPTTSAQPTLTAQPTVVTLAAPREDAPPSDPTTKVEEPAAEPPTEPDPLLTSPMQRVPWSEGEQVAGHLEGDTWPPSVALGLIRGGQIVSKIEGISAVLGEPPPSATTLCETFELQVRPEEWGEARGIRVSVWCSVGEDSLTRTEIVALYQIRDGILARAYSGLGGRLDSTMDSCVTLRQVTFKVARGKLEAHIETSTSWHDQPMDPAFMSALRAQCHVSTSRRLDKIQVWR